MSSIVKTFYSIEGTQYRVTLSGSNVTGNESFDLAADPVRLSFQRGRHKCDQLRTYTMKLSVVTSQDLTHLYSDSPTGTYISLEHQNASSWSYDFCGYLESLSFSQPYSGVNDTITLRAVDLLSAATRQRFTLSSTGAATKTLRQYLCDICSACSITYIVAAPATDDPFAASVPENVFLKADFANEPSDTTYAAVVSAIMATRGYTAMCVGQYLFCVNQVNVTSSSRCCVITASSGSYFIQNFAPLAPTFTLNEAAVRDSDMQLSVEQAYGRIRIKPKGIEKGYFIPDLLKNGTPAAHNGSFRFLNTENKWVQVRYLKNTGIDWTVWSTDYSTQYHEADFDAGRIQFASDWFGAIPVEISFWSHKNEFNGVTTKRAIFCRVGSMSTVIYSGRHLFSVKPGYCGSGVGAFVFRCSMASRTDNDSSYLYPPILGGASGDVSETNAEVGEVSIPADFYFSRGSKYYVTSDVSDDLPEGQWFASKTTPPFRFGRADSRGEKQLNPNYYGIMTEMQADWIADPTNQDSSSPLVLECVTANARTRKQFWLFDPVVERLGHWGANAAESATYVQTINSGNPEELSVNVFFDYEGGSAHGSQAVNPIADIMNSLKTWYRNPHRILQCTVSEGVHPYSIVLDGTTSGTQRTIDAMEWDIRNGKTRIVIS